MAFITSTDLELYISDLTKFYSGANVGNIDIHIATAEGYVMRHIETVWFPQAAQDFYFSNQQTNLASAVPIMDPAFLNTDLLKNTFIFRALGYNICPSLMKSSDPTIDSFASKGEYFRTMFADEFDNAMNTYLYDFNKDGNFNNRDITLSQINKRTIKARRG